MLRPKEVQVLAFLATQGDRSVTNDDIRAALGQGGDEDPSAETVRTYLSRIRAVVSSEVLPDAVERRYRLANVEVDLARFDQLCTEASAAQPAEARTRLTDALKLVRGRPFGDVDFPWTSIITARLERQIADAAQRLALLSREARDHDATRWAPNEA